MKKIRARKGEEKRKKIEKEEEEKGKREKGRAEGDEGGAMAGSSGWWGQGGTHASCRLELSS